MYIAGRTKISPGMLIYNLQFFPEKLRHFKLVYQNAFYRVFRLDYSALPQEKFKVLNYQPIFEQKTYTNGLQRQVDALDVIKVIEKVNQANNYFRSALSMAERGFIDEAISTAKKGLQFQPNLTGMHRKLGFWYLAKQDFEKAISEMEKELQNTAFLPNGYYDLGYVYSLMRNFRKAREYWIISLELD